MRGCEGSGVLLIYGGLVVCIRCSGDSVIRVIISSAVKVAERRSESLTSFSHV